MTPAPASVVNDVTNIPASVYNTVGTGPSGAVQPADHHPRPQPADPRRQEPVHPLLRCRVLPVLRGRALGADRRPLAVRDLVRICRSPPRPRPTSTRAPTPSATTARRSPAPTSPSTRSSSTPTSPTANGYSAYTVLQNPTKEEATGHQPPTTARPTSPVRQQGQISFPFIDINNLALISGASYNPGHPGRPTWTDIANGLSNPTTRHPGDRRHRQLHLGRHLREHQERTRVGLHELGRDGCGQGPQAELTGTTRSDGRAHASGGNPSSPRCSASAGSGWRPT